jgi:predicted HTH transcriptional regulator
LFPAIKFVSLYYFRTDFYSVATYIQKLIEQGENQQLDFKFEISDSRKIARTLCAFANTDGGTLLIGVKDNGRIAGVRTDEEYYMAEAAARMYCRPEISFATERWSVEGKTVLEIRIPPGTEKPYYALTDEGKWRAYRRVKDQNILAHPVWVKVWKRKSSPKGISFVILPKKKCCFRT